MNWFLVSAVQHCLLRFRSLSRRHDEAKTHRPRYWNDVTFDAIEDIKAVANKHLLSLAEVALRWLN
ncbi:hypothetical protein CC80DRAFT_578162 [Byssothecium circinans]|uniref:NADP-dependent oxidoreductase domain-containing protein n=1 Tax=Byssothecium circinans TaxID=147558 RepID=A0A6A5U9H3_9PLEO|nr:hypothetical protein CC80DRAFT_578162 [Byssothecium circinans]